MIAVSFLCLVQKTGPLTAEAQLAAIGAVIAGARIEGAVFVAAIAMPSLGPWLMAAIFHLDGFSALMAVTDAVMDVAAAIIIAVIVIFDIAFLAMIIKDRSADCADHETGEE